MNESALVIIKPDGLQKGLTGHVLTKFADTGLRIVGMRMVRTSRSMAEAHYQNIQGQPFFKEVVEYFIGNYHKQKEVMAIVYYGPKAIRLCRTMAGATNPELASPKSIRGAYGRITTKGIFENVVHVSSDRKEAEREIKLWFKPEDLTVKLYETQSVTSFSKKAKEWK